jgi:ribonuclease HI
MKAVAYTDGSCGGNPGPMGWAALMFIDLYTKLKANYNPHPDGTNNRAEILGIIEALRMVKPFHRDQCEIIIYTDSNWVKCSLDGTYKKVKKNLDLLSTAAGLMAEYKICSLRHVRGHVGDTYNEIVDSYAVAARTAKQRFNLDALAIIGLRDEADLVAEARLNGHLP